MRITLALALALVLSAASSTPSSAQVNCSDPIRSGATAADIQSCLNLGGTVILQDGGIYDIDTTLEIVTDGTVLRGETSADQRPTLRASPDLHGHILSVEDHGGTDPRYNYSLEDLVFDGNRAGRLNQTDEC